MADGLKGSARHGGQSAAGPWHPCDATIACSARRGLAAPRIHEETVLAVESWHAVDRGEQSENSEAASSLVFLTLALPWHSYH